MKRKGIAGFLFGPLAGIVLLIVCPVAQAGPPLVCWPFDTGGAKSLPWGGTGWHDLQANYDLNRLAGDTLTLLSPDAQVLARMETLRRAAIYASKSPQAARELLAGLEQRAGGMKTSAKPDSLALFDLGYFAEAYRQASELAHSGWVSGAKHDGYDLVKRALALRGADAQMEFGAALVAATVKQNEAANVHLARAAANTADSSLLAKNLLSHCHLFQLKASTLAELRSRLAGSKS